MEQIVKNNLLNYTVAYIYPQHRAILMNLTRTRPVIFYWYVPDPLIQLLDSVRIAFPRNVPGCSSGCSVSHFCTLDSASCCAC